MSAFCVCENVYRVPAGYKSEGSEWEYVSPYVCDKCESVERVKAGDVKVGDIINSYGTGYMVYSVREIKINGNEVTLIAGNNSNFRNNFTSPLDSDWIWKVVKK